MQLARLVDDASINFDTSSFPVVLASFWGAPTHDEFAAFLDGCSQVLARRQPFVAIVDARDAGILDPKQIMDAAAWLEREDGRRRAYCRGIALVLPGPVQRTVLSAIVKLAAVGPHCIVADVPDAVAWALALMHKPIALED